jgi:chitin disaccharide deacetylase
VNPQERTREGPTPVAVCADDYGLSSGVDEGILELASGGRITAFSCLTASPRWPRAGSRLGQHFGKIDIGLHFALTQLAPLGPMPALAPDGQLPQRGRLYAKAFLRQLDLDEIEAEFSRQVDAFIASTGRVPDFVDGHHHVHQLPGIRDVVARAWGARRGWIRNTATNPAGIASRAIAPLRAAVLASIGQAARRTWRRAGIGTNADFAGVRSFHERDPFGALMRRYLSGARPGLLIMCHPGHSDAELARIDSVTATREEELAYLSGKDFPADLAAAGCQLVRLSSVAGR